MPMVSLQLSDEILQKFDDVRQETGYLSRSEALRDAILKFISEHKQQQSSTEIKRCVIPVVYSPDANKLEMFASIEHRFEDAVKSFSEYMLDEQTLRIYVLIGALSRINDFKQAFNKIKDTRIESLLI